MIGGLTGKIVGVRVIRRRCGELKDREVTKSKGSISGMDTTFIDRITLREILPWWNVC